MSDAVVTQIHETHEPEAPIEITPPHPPREDTPVYRHTHHKLIDELDTPCFVCGVRKSTLADPAQNPFGAKDLETHHWPIERSLLDALDTELLAQDYPGVLWAENLEAWVDSYENMLVLCDQCHRIAPHAIHRAHWDAFIAEKYARRDSDNTPYEFAAVDETEAAKIEAADALVLEGEDAPALSTLEG